MKKSSLLAVIGVAVIIFNNTFWLLANIMELWKNDWYNTMTVLLNVVALIGWTLIGQFFYVLYKKQK